MNSFPKSAAKHFCDKPMPQYLDPKTVLIFVRTLYSAGWDNASERFCFVVSVVRKIWTHVGILTDRCGMRPESLLCTAYDRLANQDES
jgi:hypothetical protein